MEVREFIKLMGGRNLVARVLDLTPQAVASWYFNGIPNKHAFDLANRCSMSGAGFAEYTVKFISELQIEAKKNDKTIQKMEK